MLKNTDFNFGEFVKKVIREKTVEIDNAYSSNPAVLVSI